MDTAITKKLSTLTTDVSQRLGEVSPASVYKYAALVLGAFAVKFVASELIVSFRCRHIPCPPGRIPVLGHALKLLKGNVWDTFTSYALQYASIYRMHVLGRVFIVISDPKHIKHVLQTNIQNYRKDRSAYGVFDCLLGTGIVTSEGDRWHRLRRELAPTFKLEILEDVARAAEEVTKRLYLSLDKACETGEIVDMAEHFRKLTLQVIAMAVLGCTPEESDAEISDLYMPIIDECNDRIWYPHRIYLPTLAWWAHNRLVRSLNQYLEGKVRARWAFRVKREEQALPQNPPEDILDRILANIDPVEFRKNGVRDLRDGLKTFLFAGHDTTSCMLTWTLWELMQSPQAITSAQQEVDAFFDEKKPKPSFDVVQSSLPYVFNCLRETLRLHSPVPVVTREVVNADVIGDVAVPPGAIICVLLDAVHKRPNLWPQADTAVFRPSRFGIADTTSPLTGLGPGVDPWAYLPFINGPRNCLGQHFSLLEARLVMGLLLKRYSFTPAPGQNDVAHPYKIPITPINGMRVTVSRRCIAAGKPPSQPASTTPPPSVTSSATAPKNPTAAPSPTPAPAPTADAGAKASSDTSQPQPRGRILDF